MHRKVLIRKRFKCSVCVGLLFFFSLSSFAQADSIQFYDTHIHNDSLSLSQRENWVDLAIQYAVKIDNIAKLSEYSSFKSNLLFANGRYQEAVELNRRLIAILLPKIKDKHYKEQYVNALSNLGLSLVFSDQGDEAMKYFRIILDNYAEDTLSIAMAKTYNGMGVAFAYRKHYEIAISYFEKSLPIYKHLKDYRGEYNIASNLGLALLLQNKYDEAILYFKRAEQIVLEQAYKGDEMVHVLFNMASGYLKQKRYVLAEENFLEAIRTAQKGKYKTLEELMRYHYAVCLNIQGKAKQANQWLRELMDVSFDTKGSGFQVDLLRLQSSIYEKLGEYKQANICLNRSIAISDSFYLKENEEKLLKLKFELDNYKLEQEKIARTRDLELSKEKLRSRNMLIFILSGLVLLVLFFLFRTLIRVVRQRKETKEIEDKFNTQKMSAQERMEDLKLNFYKEIEAKNKELATNAILFLRLNSLSGDVLDKIKKLKLLSSIKGKDRFLLLEAEQLVEQLNSEKGWSEFEFYFEQVDKSFLSNLETNYPELTPNERRLCVLFSLNLSNKEIAELTQKNIHSIATAKFRIRKKMGLEREEDLLEIFHKM